MIPLSAKEAGDCQAERSKGWRWPVLLKRPSVILFDEPTVGLDLHTERVLRGPLPSLQARRP